MELDAQVGVIGVGTMGSMTLWQLAARGIPAIGFEQFHVGHELGAGVGEARQFRDVHLEDDVREILPLAEPEYRRLEADSGLELLTLNGGLTIGSRDSGTIRGLVERISASGNLPRWIEHDEMRARYPQHWLRDDDVVLWFADHRTSGLDLAADLGSKVADTIVGLAVALVLAVWVSRKVGSWRPAVYYAVLVGPTLALYLVVTALVPRDRPPVKILDPGLVPDHSFPSGHVILVAAVTCVVVDVLPPTWAWALFAVPLLVMLGRVYVGAHNPLDVTAGLGAGLVVGGVLAVVLG